MGNLTIDYSKILNNSLEDYKKIVKDKCKDNKEFAKSVYQDEWNRISKDGTKEKIINYYEDY